MMVSENLLAVAHRAREPLSNGAAVEYGQAVFLIRPDGK